MWQNSHTGTGQEGRRTVEKQKSIIFNPDGDSHSGCPFSSADAGAAEGRSVYGTV